MTREERFLGEINRDLPTGVDWKSGAIEYYQSSLRDKEAHSDLHARNKPFCAGPDFGLFVANLSRFVAMVSALNLPARAHILDVGAGPGWVSEYFAKLGHVVLGIDICGDFVEIARERLNAAPFEVFPGEKPAAEFLVHDIEMSPVLSPRRFDLAYFESTLHHFLNPVAALRHAASSLKDDGVIAILEGAAPPVESDDHRKLVNAMAEFHTIERPYSRGQIRELFAITGFEYYRFYFPLFGLYEPSEAEELKDLVANGVGWNIVIASRTAAGLTRLCRHGAPPADSFSFGGGFYGEELDPAGRRFRWCAGRGLCQLSGSAPVRLTIGTYPPSLAGRKQQVFVFVDGRPRQTCVLTEDHFETELMLDGTPERTAGEVRFESDCLFHPGWFALPDSRSLSFWVRVETEALPQAEVAC
jgi:SAM-dependent methyltransferase